MRNQFRIVRTSRKQGGWLLIQLALAMVVISWLATQDLVKQYDQIADTKFIAVAKGLDVIRNSGNDFLASYYDAIKSGAPIPLPSGGTITVNTQPSIENLRELGKVPIGSTGKSLIAGGAYKIFISGNPVGCDLADPACNLDGLACIDIPLKDRATVDFPRLGMAARRIGSDGAYSTLEAPTRMGGMGGAWSTANPFGAVPGILCARFGYSSSGLAAFVRKDGTVAMTGNFNAGGNSIINSKEITATGTVKGAQFLTEIKSAGETCNELGAIASGSVTSMICDGAKWQINTGLRAETGGDCYQDGVTAVSRNNGQMLVCKNAKYVKLINMLSKKIIVGRYPVQHGTTVLKPQCDIGGTPDYSFSVTQVTLDLTSNPPKQSVVWNVSDSPSTWQVVNYLVDDVGGSTPGTSVGLTAVMNVECSY